VERRREDTVIFKWDAIPVLKLFKLYTRVSISRM
jgi:hypothetical protein